MIRLSVVALPLLLGSIAFADTDVPVGPFTGINAHGGARVTLRHGTTQRVTVIKGDMKVARITVKNGNSLDIDPCPNSFWSCISHHNDLEVEIVAPRVESFQVHGGAMLNATGAFPKEPALSLEAHGGGMLDVKAIPAETVNAEAHGGGQIHTNVISKLAAEAHGGGIIRYSGNPQQIVSQGHGGGTISKE